MAYGCQACRFSGRGIFMVWVPHGAPDVMIAEMYRHAGHHRVAQTAFSEIENASFQ